MPEPEIEAKPLPTNEYAGPYFRSPWNDGAGHWYCAKEWGSADLFVWVHPETGEPCAEPYPPEAWPEPLPDIHATWVADDSPPPPPPPPKR